MGLLERLRDFTTVAPAPAPAVGLARLWVVREYGTVNSRDGTELWREGFAPIDPESGRYLCWDAPEMTDAGIRITHVAGVSYRRDALQDNRFAPGSTLLLRPEPDNPHDGNAIGVWDQSGTMQVGYLDRQIAAELAPDMRRGRGLGAFVLQEYRLRPDGERCSLVIALASVGMVEVIVEDEDEDEDEELDDKE
jgi:hypothetical protein